MRALFTVLFTGIGLAMDAFAVSLSDSMTKKLTKPQFVAYPLCFGLYQGLMPLVGYFIGSAFSEQVAVVDHWIALALLGFIGIKMLIEGVKEYSATKRSRKDGAEKEQQLQPQPQPQFQPQQSDCLAPDQMTNEIKEVSNAESDLPSEVKKSSNYGKFSLGEMLFQGLATSIDALAVGITLALTVQMSVYLAVAIIAVVTFVISLLGMVIGKRAGSALGSVAGIAGGVILTLIGIKIFLEHML